MQTETILKELGLGDKEVAVFLALLEMGPSPVRSLAVRAGVNRGTTYDILKKLINDGLVSFFDKTNHQYFAAEPPEKLLTLINGKKLELDDLGRKVEANLPELKLRFERRGGKPVMKMFEGRKGIKTILEDILSSVANQNEKQYYVFSSATVRKNVYQAMPDFSDKRIKKEIKVKTISFGEGGQLVGLDERKWLKTDQKDIAPTYEIIYAGKVAHISLDDSENPVGMVIQDRAIYETQKMIFEFNWNKL
jgi:sugar-specific transcriptional regulator TrmB